MANFRPSVTTTEEAKVVGNPDAHQTGRKRVKMTRFGDFDLR